ncbi:hypothetical protein PR202_ga00421 [Eleusine coracana subsp. coracana]|uniref:Pectinesterase inhibitor domain-containing protein n=1 Tax=Eleusine coracana subsp. coracana TaxID=191504 RepID=A0AAV5BG75_ELECO|nr:hypothetical protein PR202_ga00421 [Eleusine coracana subsp. coracana]
MSNDASSHLPLYAPRHCIFDDIGECSHHLVPVTTRRATTLYRVACYDSLIPYGCTFQTSHVKLARAATDVNHVQLRTLSKRVKELVAIGGATSSLRDCAGTISSAAGLARQSSAELAKLDNAGPAAARSEVRWAISNAQTWLSAAMTNEATCADGLGAAGGEVSREIASAKEHTSIALALVNGIPLPP